MDLYGRIALLVFAATVASILAYSAAIAADSSAAIAGDEAKFNKLRAELARKNAAKEEARRPAHFGQAKVSACQIKPVMTDAEIDACRKH